MAPKVNEFRTPTLEQQQDFALKLYFGNGDPLTRSIRRAYLDLCRTAHGIGSHGRKVEESKEAIRGSIEEICHSEMMQDQFDDWHKNLCLRLCEIFEPKFNFTVGQAQKWVNMTFKYLYVFGEAKAPGYRNLYQFCHVPIDKVIMKALKNLPQHDSGSDFQVTWSRIEDYSEYLAFQERLRIEFKGSSPLAVEFWLWQGESQ